MNKYVAFLRAINVAGHAIVKMSDLQDAFTSAGCKGVRTYIQSGNVIFESPEKNGPAVFPRIRVRLRALFRDEPTILFRTVRELEGIVEGGPFAGFAAEPHTKLYITFLSRRPQIKPRLPFVSSKEGLEVVAMKKLEVFVVSRRKPNGFYGFPNGYIERELGVLATSRNWSTLSKFVEFIRKDG